MRAPTSDPIITSPFGLRTNPPGNHPGIDLRAAKGIEIFAPEDVTFLRSGVGAEYHENFIVMKGRETNLVHKFMHTMRIGLTEGVSYQEGMVIGQSDCSGTDAAHCHWEVWKGGKQDGWSGGVIDPEEFYLKLYGIPYKHKEG